MCFYLQISSGSWLCAVFYLKNTISRFQKKHHPNVTRLGNIKESLLAGLNQAADYFLKL